ncbi:MULTISPECIES: hypothetical protein [unclassified Agromyces]|uniref:hypothetical protein n=1 Tax=unclassified Agromyces TaxID=2639701 RepID=UPI003014BC00
MSDPAEQDPRDPRDPTPWWQDQTDVGGIGMARLFAWSALLMGIGALGIAIFAPLAGDALRTVWIAGFGTVAIWVAGMAPPRYRREGVRVPWAVPAAMVLGGLAILVAAYAFIVIAAASGGVELPAPEHWLPPSAPARPGVPT